MDNSAEAMDQDDPYYFTTETWLAQMPSLRNFQYFSTMENLHQPSKNFQNYNGTNIQPFEAVGAQLVGCASPFAVVKKITLLDNHFYLDMSDNTRPWISVKDLSILQYQLNASSALTIHILPIDTREYNDPRIWKYFLKDTIDLTVLGFIDSAILSTFLTYAGGIESLQRLNVLPSAEFTMDLSAIYALLPHKMEHLYIDESYVRDDADSELYIVPGTKQPLVRKLVFNESKIIMALDTMEQLEVETTSPAMEAAFQNLKSHRYLEICCLTITNDVYCRIPWKEFLVNMECLTLDEESLTFDINEIAKFVAPHTVNCNINCAYPRNAILDPQTLGINLQQKVVDIYIDTRGTPSSGMIDNITSLYFFFANQPRIETARQNFTQITLIVSDFCVGVALDRQLQRLSEMLISSHGTRSTATVISMAPGDDSLLEDLERIGFIFTHRGYIQNMDRKYDQIDFWTYGSGSKWIILGLKTRDSRPLEYSDIQMTHISLDE